MDARIRASQARAAKDVADALAWRQGETNRLKGGAFDALTGVGVPANSARGLSGLIDFVPGLGEVSGAEDAYQAASAGDYKGAAVNGAGTILGLVPGIGDAAGAALGIFAGGLARTANLPMMKRAQEMAAAGGDKRAIWDQTGWFQGADGKWRFEIDDSDAYLEATQRGGGEVLRHEAFAEAYPEFMGDLQQAITRGGMGGHYDPQYKTIVARGETPNERLSVALHELQHGVQHMNSIRQPMALGGNPREFSGGNMMARPDVKRIMEENPEFYGLIARKNMIEADLVTRYGKNFSDVAPPHLVQEWSDVLDQIDAHPVSDQHWEAISEDPNSIYRRLAGEVEARNVQSRLSMTPEQRRATPPWETEDTPRERQIVRFR